MLFCACFGVFLIRGISVCLFCASFGVFLIRGITIVLFCACFGVFLIPGISLCLFCACFGVFLIPGISSHRKSSFLAKNRGSLAPELQQNRRFSNVSAVIFENELCKCVFFTLFEAAWTKENQGFFPFSFC